MTQRVFNSKERTIQELKCAFLGNLVCSVSLYIGEGSMPSIDFVD